MFYPTELSTDEYYNDILIWGNDEPEEDEDLDRDYWENMAEDALMEHYLGLDA